MDRFEIDFKDKLAKAMKDKGYSANRLAKEIEIDRASISKYLNGHSYPQINTFLAICKVLNVEPNYFLKIDYVDYLNDNSKTTERKIIESIFCLCDNGIITENRDSYMTNQEFAVNSLVPIILHKIIEECIRYAGSEFIQSEEICKKIADKYEDELIDALEKLKKEYEEYRKMDI